MLDGRAHAFRPDLADEGLKGKVEASRFVKGKAGQLVAPLTGLYRSPSANSRIETQVLLGEQVKVFERKDGWAWVQCLADGYVGYVPEASLGAVGATSHRVAAVSTHLYPTASIKDQPAVSLYMGSLLNVAGLDGEFLRLAGGGFVYGAHAVPVKAFAADAVAVAEQFLHVPYLWGGRSFAGIDCSGLVQIARQACGIASPRDADQQEEAIAVPLPLSMLEGATERGLLIFWPGHVAITLDDTRIIHASGHQMKVVIEDRLAVMARYAAKGIQVSRVGRIQ